MSPPRLLVELALLGPAVIAERHAVKETVLLIRRQLVGIGVNINQLAHWANGRQQLPPGLDSSLAAVERMEARVSDLVEALERS
ncbi:MAG TPA: MobC family plasmid mobilization relaxosome protein [Actinomycetota bacterium]|nr:MobC family plasmid mobilization relaxosome protein [Actinomycetota bacterium]